MSKDTLIDEARALEQKVNDAFCELKKFKEQHPDTRNGFYTNQPGSWLNAYREGDLAFMDAIDLIETYARQIAADAVRTERSRIGQKITELDVDSRSTYDFGFLVEKWYEIEFAAELKEAQTDDR